MIYTLIIKEDAASDIEEALDYYEDQVSGLGFNFVQELDVSFNQLKRNPLHYSFFLNQKKFRSHSLKHFPYSIICEVIEYDVTVFAVYNHHQNPDNILKRL